MDREILFRAKSIVDCEKKDIEIKKGDWVYGYYLYSTLPLLNGHLIYIPNEEFNSPYYIKIDKDTLGQLVCIRKIKGQEVKIFEGDILEVYEECPIGIIKLTGVIEYDDRSCCYMIDFPMNGMSKGLEYYFEEDYSDDILLLGNQYDNPELLEIEGELLNE